MTEEASGWDPLTPIPDLSALGLDCDGERMLRYILATRGGPPRIIATALDLPTALVERELARMIDIGLIRTIKTDIPEFRPGEGIQPSGAHELSYVPQPPQRMLTRLFADQAAGLLQAGAAVEQLSRLYLTASEYGERSQTPVQTIHGMDEVNEAVFALLNQTSERIQLLDRQPFVRENHPRALGPTMFGLLERGVDVRTIYAANTYRLDGYSAYINAAGNRGERSRVLARLPMRFLLSDRECAVLPIAAEGPWVSSAIVVTDALLVADLAAVFDECWDRSLPLGDTEISAGIEFTADEVGLLRMLANDMTEDAISRQLETSSRTVGRRLALLQRKLGTHTRFGMGAEASRLDLL